MRYKAPKGTQDILPETSYKWNYIEGAFRKMCYQYGYEEIRTPILEQTELFIRGLGDSSDIVSKEMYSLTTKGNDNLTMKPEGTAPAVRAYIERSLCVPGSVSKLFYIAPIFRYERPQAGRYRQAHQLGMEAIGSADPMADAEIIIFTMNFYKNLGIKEPRLKLNSVGTASCRPAYRQALMDYAKPHLTGFDEEYLNRLEKNPLRLLDSKDPDIQAIMKNAPDIFEYLDDECLTHFTQLEKYLTLAEVPFERDRYLVRGLDYYTKTAFEVVSGSLGAQSALCGGGRYDGLIEECGGPSTPAVGVAMGIERALIVMESQGAEFPPKPSPQIYIVTIGNTRTEAFQLLYALRGKGLSVDIELTERSLKAQMRQADKSGAEFAIVMGEDELARGAVQIRNLKDSTQEEIPLSDVLAKW